MKKLFGLLLVLLMVSSAWGIETSSQTYAEIPNSNLSTLTFDIITDESGNFVARETRGDITRKIAGKLLYMVGTIPGATNPTALWNAVITDVNRADILGGAANDRSASAGQFVMPLAGGSYAPVPITGALTIDITDNTVNSASMKVILYFVKP